MLTRIIIRHTDADTLKDSTLWQEIMAVAFRNEPVSVIEIGEYKYPETEDVEVE
jgi:hypothetical protein